MVCPLQPSFFKWLTKKYPRIVADVIEERSPTSNEEMAQGGKRFHLSLAAVQIAASAVMDTSGPNPNGIEYDCLYLDMNGIIHPCCAPPNKEAPPDEESMFVAIGKYIDRIFSMVRPRKLLYMAIDGVAPRAKMNRAR